MNYDRSSMEEYKSNAINADISNPDLVTSGYFREYETNNSILIPSDIQKEVSKYCQAFDIKHIGNNKSCLHNDNIIASIMNKLYSHHVAQTPSSQSLKLISTGMTDTKFKFIYTTNHRLFQCFEDDNLHEIEQSFLRRKNDEIIDIKCGKKHCLFLTKCGDVYCIGSNDSGQCGLEMSTFYVPTPTLIPMKNNLKINAISCGNFHSLFIDEKHRLLCCGYSFLGQCGMMQSKSMSCSSYPESMSEATDSESESADSFDDTSISDTSSDFLSFSMVDSDDESSDDSDLEMDGDDDDDFKYLDQQIIWTPTLNPYFIDCNVKFCKIECGVFHSLCLAQNGEVWVFGSNYFGNLGTGKCTKFGQGIHEPLRLEMNEKIIDIAAGSNHNLLLTQTNKIMSFGHNANNQCSTQMSKERILYPIILCKESEFNVGKHSFVEKLLCFDDKSLIVINPFKRANVV